MPTIPSPILKGIAVALGPWGSPLEAWLQARNDAELAAIQDAIQRGIASGQASELHVLESIHELRDDQQAMLALLHALMSILLNDHHHRITLQMLSRQGDAVNVAQVTAVVQGALPSTPPTTDEIGRVLRHGIRKAKYTPIETLWSDIEDTGFAEEDFPFGVFPLTRAASEFVKMFWRQELDSAQPAVLMTLMQRNQAVTEFAQAVLQHHLLRTRLAQ